MTDNIFFDPTAWGKHDTAPFDRIRVEDYEPAFLEGMRLEDEAIERITSCGDEPTFQNTIAPRTDELLSRVSSIFFNLLNAHTSDAMDALAQKLSPMLTEHANRISMNEALFQRVRYVYEHPGQLDAEQQKLLEDVYQGFVRSGALLSPEDKERLSALKVELSTLTIQFDQNELKEMNAYQLHVTDEAHLSGLPDTARQAAHQAAEEKELPGWLFTLHAPSYTPFMTYADNRDLRRQMYEARGTMCNHGDACDNKQIVSRIVNIRRQIAQLLGYSCYADYALLRRMAQSTNRVYELLDNLLQSYKPIAEEEMAEVRQLAQELEGADFQLMPWDLAYYSHKLKLQRFNLDAEMLRPYFQLEKVKDGVFGLATKLYGITFQRNKNIAVYHPDVEAYEVVDSDGSFLAVLYADFFPRASKQGGAWMTSYLEQYTDDDGTDHRPHVSICMNLTKPTSERPSLLTLGEVETFLHEFGHALHGMFSKVRYQSMGGTNVYWDFVELPSQFMENYAQQAAFLHTFARHYQTDEPLPEELIQRITDSRNFQCGYACVRQVSFGLLDMAYYTLKEEFTADVPTYEREAWQTTQLLPPVEGACMSVQFGHIMSGGYAAGYYSYKWAEVLDADAFSLFLQRGIFDQETAASFRRNILSRGGTEHPMDLYVRFRGKQPTIEALLKRNGIGAKNE